jgi:hypothetical protein
MRASVSCKFVDESAVRCFFAGAGDTTKAAVELHLSACPRCRRKLHLFARVWRWDGSRRAERQDGLSVSDDAATMSRLLA